MKAVIFGAVFVIFGIIYLIKPDIYRRGIWLKTSIAQRTLSPEGYLKYMRAWGAVMILVGGLLLYFGISSLPGH
jgi:hypothetical protein